MHFFLQVFYFSENCHVLIETKHVQNTHCQEKKKVEFHNYTLW